MEELKMEFDGAFTYMDGEQQVGIMKANLNGKILTVFSTEVVPEKRGKGVAGKLFKKMIAFVEQNDLKVKSHCSYVDAQLNRNNEKYGDLVAK